MENVHTLRISGLQKYTHTPRSDDPMLNYSKVTTTPRLSGERVGGFLRRDDDPASNRVAKSNQRLTPVSKPCRISQAIVVHLRTLPI